MKSPKYAVNSETDKMVRAAYDNAINTVLDNWKDEAGEIAERTAIFARTHTLPSANVTAEHERLIRVRQSISAAPDFAWKTKLELPSVHQRLKDTQERADYELAQQLQQLELERGSIEHADAEYARKLQEQYVREDTRASRTQRGHERERERDVLEYEPINMPAGEPIEPTLIYTPSTERVSAEQRQAQAKMDRMLKIAEEVTGEPISDKYKRDLADRERSARDRTAQFAPKREQPANRSREYAHLQKKADELQKSFKFGRPDDEPAPVKAPLLTIESIMTRDTPLTDEEKKQIPRGSKLYITARRRGLL